MAIVLHITMTGKSYSPRDQWRIFADESHRFQDLAQAKAFIRERYGKAKRVRMFRDVRGPGDPEGVYSQVKHTGYVIGFRADDGAGARYLQQDWVEFRECKLVDLEATA